MAKINGTTKTMTIVLGIMALMITVSSATYAIAMRSVGNDVKTIQPIVHIHETRITVLEERFDTIMRGIVKIENKLDEKE